MKNELKEKTPRITVTLGQGQRESIQAIAERNHTTPTFLVRYAVDRLIDDLRQKQLRLDL